MKRFLPVLLLVLLLLPAGCGKKQTQDNTVAATTKPVAEFASAIVKGTDVQITPVITEEVSCLHDHTLTVSQMKVLEQADAVIISGLGLEDFMADVLKTKSTVIDASRDISSPNGDPHIWLSPALAADMAKNITSGLVALYPQHASTFRENLGVLLDDLLQLQAYAHLQTSSLSCRELITFHDGFTCFADTLDLEILASMEVEHGSEPAAKDLIRIAELVKTHSLPAVFTEVNGTSDAAGVVAKETGCRVYALDMAMGNKDYFTAMRYNIDTVKEALS